MKLISHIIQNRAAELVLLHKLIILELVLSGFEYFFFFILPTRIVLIDRLSLFGPRGELIVF